MRTLLYLGFLLSALASTGYAEVQELILCSQPLGSSKTGCDTNKLLLETPISMHHTLTYDYVCKYNYTTSVPVLTPGPIAENLNVNYGFTPGVGLIVEVPEARQLYFRYSTTQQPVLHKDCSLKVHSIKSRPSAATIELWTQEAKRLTQLLGARSDHYRHLVDVHRLIDDYTLIKLKAMSKDLQLIFNSTIEIALTKKETGPPGPPKPPGTSTSKLPADYNLNIPSWQQLDVFALGIVALKANEPRYELKLDSTNIQHKWYFDAKNTLSIVSGLLSQVAIVEGACLLKEQAANSGYVIPEPGPALDALQAVLVEAKDFLNLVKVYQELLQQHFDQLQNQVNSQTPTEGETP